ncbi:MAG: SMP-30/gluconolactonase/LRE family protein [Alphaproteobacteria bacterium]|nr:SMP-30/gluconolactonase/LRE family protein [Alphaproteobacteria bacterium]
MIERTKTCRSLSRRGLLAGSAGLAGAAALSSSGARAQQNAELGAPATVISNPPRDFARGHPSIYPDPDVIVVDPSFLPLRRSQGAIYRVWTGALWAEGPAWSSQGRYVVFSDVSGDVQYRYIWDDGRVTVFRRPSYNSNGNTFDFQGRQISCEHFNRRVIRWEHDGSVTVIADSYDGKALNSPNDVVPHPDGSIWFTDPPYGGSVAEGHPDEPGGASNRQGLFNARAGAETAFAIGGRRRELSTNVYRWDPSGRLDVVITEDQLADPNGICFSPDYKTLYVISTGKGPGDAGPGGTRSIYAFDVQGTKVGNVRLFTDMTVDGVKCGPDGMRADVSGNLWCSSNAPLGYAGVLVFNPAGKLIGRIRLPEVCANLCFGGPKRDRLFMAGSQSLYMMQVATQGAAPG